jgi:hypothetical protein
MDADGTDLTDFDRYVEEHGIPEEDYPAAFALWIAERTGGPVPDFEESEGDQLAGPPRREATMRPWRGGSGSLCGPILDRRTWQPLGW